MNGLGYLHAIGLTGGIGAGKSMVSSILRERGLTVMDADVLARRVHHDPHVCEQLVDFFGHQVVDYSVSDSPSVVRSELARIAFSSQEGLKALNRIMHPAMKQLIRDEISLVDGRVVLDAAILFEAGWQDLVESTVVVVCPLDVRIDRIRARGGISEDQIKARIHAQMTDAQRMAHADYLIYNVGSVDLLRDQVERIFFGC